MPYDGIGTLFLIPGLPMKIGAKFEVSNRRYDDFSLGKALLLFASFLFSPVDIVA